MNGSMIAAIIAIVLAIIAIILGTLGIFLPSGGGGSSGSDGSSGSKGDTGPPGPSGENCTNCNLGDPGCTQCTPSPSGGGSVITVNVKTPVAIHSSGTYSTGSSTNENLIGNGDFCNVTIEDYNNLFDIEEYAAGLTVSSQLNLGNKFFVSAAAPFYIKTNAQYDGDINDSTDASFVPVTNPTIISESIPGGNYLLQTSGGNEARELDTGYSTADILYKSIVIGVSYYPAGYLYEFTVSNIQTFSDPYPNFYNAYRNRPEAYVTTIINYTYTRTALRTKVENPWRYRYGGNADSPNPMFSRITGLTDIINNEGIANNAKCCRDDQIVDPFATSIQGKGATVNTEPLSNLGVVNGSSFMKYENNNNDVMLPISYRFLSTGDTFSYYPFEKGSYKLYIVPMPSGAKIFDTLLFSPYSGDKDGADLGKMKDYYSIDINAQKDSVIEFVYQGLMLVPSGSGAHTFLTMMITSSKKSLLSTLNPGNYIT